MTFEQTTPLRVAVISEFPYQGVIVGGVHSAVDVLVRTLSQSPEVEKVLVISFVPGIDRDEIILMNDKLTLHYAAGQRRLALPTNSYLDFIKAKRILNEFKPDVVHGQGTLGHGSVTVRLGYPSVVTIHGVGSFDAELKHGRRSPLGSARIYLTQKMAENAIRKADVLVSISDFDRAYASRVRDGIVMKIPNAIRPEFFERAPEFPDSARINFSGVIIKRKNVLGLVRAFKKIREKVPEAILDIAGPATEPEYFEEVEQTIDSSVKDAVIFHGNLGSDTLIDVTRQASVCVLFSVYENLPVVIGEALSLGKPVVASRVGAVAEMVDDGKTGFIVESGDEQSLADRVVQLLSDKNLRVRMGTRGRERATSTWKPESVVAETLEAYRVAIRTKQQSSGARAIGDGESMAV